MSLIAFTLPPFPFPALVLAHRRQIPGGGGEDGDHRRRHNHMADPGIWRTNVGGGGFRAVVFGVSYFSPNRVAESAGSAESAERVCGPSPLGAFCIF